MTDSATAHLFCVVYASCLQHSLVCLLICMQIVVYGLC